MGPDIEDGRIWIKAYYKGMEIWGAGRTVEEAHKDLEVLLKDSRDFDNDDPLENWVSINGTDTDTAICRGDPTKFVDASSFILAELECDELREKLEKTKANIVRLKEDVYNKDRALHDMRRHNKNITVAHKKAVDCIATLRAELRAYRAAEFHSKSQPLNGGANAV